MAEEEPSKHGRPRFLSKSKWGRVLKENDTPAPNGQPTTTFKLNEDVVDFLKPSTDKAASTRQNFQPKINVAIAQRWPDAHEVRRASEASTPLPSTGAGKPKRRKGLTVGFVKTVPEIIGEGGDDASDPPAEIGRQKTRRLRSVSDMRSSSRENRAPWTGAQAPRPDARRALAAPPQPEDDFRPQPVRRVQTSHYELSPAMQRKYASPPLEPLQHRPTLNRTPTGLDSEDESRWTHISDTDNHPTQHVHPTLDTTFVEGRTAPRFDSVVSEMALNAGIGNTKRLLPLPKSPHSPADAKRRDMQASEGMALRRASAMFIDEDQGKDEEGVSTGVQPPSQFYSIDTEPSAAKPNSDLTSPSTPLSPGSAIGPNGPSPFTNPRYIKRYSAEMALTPASSQSAPPNAQSLRHSPTNKTPSNMQTQPNGEMPVRQKRELEQPSYMRAGWQPKPTDQSSYMPATQAPFGGPDLAPVPPSDRPPQVQPESRQLYSVDEPSYMRDMQPPGSAMIPTGPAPAPAQSMKLPQDSSRADSRSSMRDRIFDSQIAVDKRKIVDSRSNHPDGSSNNFSKPSRLGHGRTYSQDNPPTVQEPVGGTDQSQSALLRQFQQQRLQYENQPTSMLNSTQSSTAQRSRSPHAQGRNSTDYFSISKAPSQQLARSPAANLRDEEAGRPSSPDSNRSVYRAAASPLPPMQGDPAADNALADFAGRVAHMNGVLRLTAEKERSADRCTPQHWLRAALWWYLKGKTGLETVLQQRPKSFEVSAQRELLLQPHVDLAKAWWILSDPLEPYDTLDSTSQHDAASSGRPDDVLRQSVTVLRSHLKSLSLSMGRNKLMPPHQSLIQGQDTRIWLEYPRYTSDVAAVLSGNTSNNLVIENGTPSIDALDALPLADTRDTFCYGRFHVDVSLNTEDATTDRVVLPCILSMLRSRANYQPSIVIASQSELVSLQVGPKHSYHKGLTFSDVSWKASPPALAIHLPRGFDLTVRMQEREFRSLWNLVEYSCKVENSLRPQPNEKLVHEARLAEVQYANSSKTNAFPSDKIRGCTALVFECSADHTDGSGTRKAHRGHRLLLVTNPDHKSLSTVSHETCRRTPLYFEFITNAAANGTTAMVIRIREDDQQCKILLVFPDIDSRQALYDVLNGITVGADETIVDKMTLLGLDVKPLPSSTEATSPPTPAHPMQQALLHLQWQKLGITNAKSDDPHTTIPDTVESEHLRVIARHATGCITDRMNLGKGELLLRLPCSNANAVEILREPQEDLTVSIDTKNSAQAVTNGISELLHTVQRQPTIRVFTFASAADLHAFQASVTGFTVRHDGVASTFGISRRMMVVPIHFKQQASHVRIQVVAQRHVVLFLAFMEDFAHASALCFQVKSTDNFERIKGDGKSKKWAVKMVDAKFSLPNQEKGEVDPDEAVRRRFVNLEGLEYAHEHDDITVGFDTEEERDRFAQALPAATTVGRGITLKRRI